MKADEAKELTLKALSSENSESDSLKLREFIDSQIKECAELGRKHTSFSLFSLVSNTPKGNLIFKSLAKSLEEDGFEIQLQNYGTIMQVSW